MVYGVCGRLGGGKSFSCVYLMLQALKRGWWVTSNIKLKDEYLKRKRINALRYTYIDDFGTVDPWTLRKGDLRGSGGSVRSMIVIDEAGEWLDSYADARQKGTQLNDIASWLRQSDKLGQDVYFIVQFENLLHNRLRSIVHKWLICKDLSKFKLPVVGLRLPPFVRDFIVCTEFDGRSKDYVGRLWLPKNKEIFDAYDTAAFFGLSWANSKGSETLDSNGCDYSSLPLVSARYVKLTLLILVALWTGAFLFIVFFFAFFR